MSGGERALEHIYAEAGSDPARLPWEGRPPSSMLRRAVGLLPRGSRALDLGCGAGPYAVWMAERGLDVTGVDLFEQAVTMARARAARAGVSATFVASDLHAFEAEPFALVYDRGCLQSLVRGDVASYRERVLGLLAPGGELVLEHWLWTSPLDWRPVGPRRRKAAALTALFSGDLVLVEREREPFWAPAPHGPRVVRGRFRFVRPR